MAGHAIGSKAICDGFVGSHPIDVLFYYFFVLVFQLSKLSAEMEISALEVARTCNRNPAHNVGQQSH